MPSDVKVDRVADVVDKKLVFTQIVCFVDGKERRKLVFSADRCSGCQFCVYACPTNSIQFAGYEMLVAGMPLILDHTTCCFCGICFSLCPDRAFDFSIDGSRSMAVRLAGGAKKLENCVNCKICSEICPAEAVQFRLLKSIDDIHERKILGNELSTRINENNENNKNKNKIDHKIGHKINSKYSLKIDTEKCKLCGKCTAFCDALIAVSRDVTPSNPNPFSEILFREELCDYCGLCEKICPNEAITVESEEKVDCEVGEIAEVEITDACIECGLCKLSCPYEGVEVVKSFEGEIKVQWERLKRVCDWESCKACLNVCKSRAWYIENGELKLEPSLCRFCRACMYACPEKLIEVKLEKIVVETDWEGMLRAVDRILKERKASTGREWLSSLKPLRSSEEVVYERSFDIEYETLETRAILEAIKILDNPVYRRLFELNPDKFLKVIKSR
ncbi:MAG: hypothetical protein DSY33_03140 [Archaeoglobus sp.]|nr:MAG: hypothetical protein DSY33_03140 [Archaeoglobus sp.]